MNPLHGETLYPFAEAARRFLPKKPDGRTTHPSTVGRWALKGVLSQAGDRVWLEHARVGGRLFTSAEAIRRFIDRLSRDPSRASQMVVSSPTPSAAAMHAELELERQGF